MGYQLSVIGYQLSVIGYQLSVIRQPQRFGTSQEMSRTGPD
jgi:hypothetical protein